MYFLSMFNKTMRFVGDRVAVIAGTSLEVVEKALELIDVDYEELPTIFDMEESINNETVIVDWIDIDCWLYCWVCIMFD